MLAEYVDKEVLSSTRLIRLAYKIDYPGKDPSTITYKELEVVFRNGLKKKLNK